MLVHLNRDWLVLKILSVDFKLVARVMTVAPNVKQERKLSKGQRLLEDLHPHTKVKSERVSAQRFWDISLSTRT